MAGQRLALAPQVSVFGFPAPAEDSEVGPIGDGFRRGQFYLDNFQSLV